MDGSLPAGSQELICDWCGYPRRGLPPGGHCPECGEPPPKMACASADQVRTVEELRWLSTLAVGFWLFILGWVGAFQVALIMPLGELSIGAINYPGPKLFASALVQRTIGGQPGPQGVFGTLCVMLSALALFLLTESRIAEDRSESAWSLRRRTRWVGLLSVGGFGGLLISGFDPNIMYSGAVSINLFAIGVSCCELPANALFYLYLRALSRRLGDRRTTASLNFCVIAVPIVTFVAVPMLVFGSLGKSNLTTAWRFSIMVYGAIALAVGVVGTSAVLRLTWVVTVAAFGGSVAAARRASLRVPQLLRESIAGCDHYWPRWCAVIGLLLWLWSVPLCIQNVLYTPTRVAVGGGVPLLNFAGPKVSSYSLVRAAAMRGEETTEIIQSQVSADALTLLAVWLTTYSMPGLDRSRRWRWAARYGILSVVAASSGVVLSVNNLDSLGPSHFTAWAVLTTEAPATFIFYVYLSHLAGQLADFHLALRLKQIAWTAPVLAVAPLPTLILSMRLHHWRQTWAAAGLGAAYVTVSLLVSMLAACCVARLACRLGVEAIGPAAATEDWE